MLNEKELLFVVDAENHPIEPRPRKEVHENGYWHRNSHVWAKNAKGQILCGQRSLKKDTNPGRWEPFFGGHVLAGEDYLETAVKECGEELGFDLKDEDMKLFKILKLGDRTKEFVAVYGLRWNGDASKIDFEKDEIDQVGWFDAEELRLILCVKRDPAWSIMGYDAEVLDWLAREV
jgi:8-oxo-dGTP diphosphatase